MVQDRDGPLAPFKRALALTMKTIAAGPDLIVNFGGEAPAVQGNRVQLPQLSLDLPKGEVAITRGLADSFALKLANHDAAVHSRYQPEGRNARAVFEAVEQARVEAIGARIMPGMANNLGAMLDDRYQKRSFANAAERKDAPLEEALALVVRERLTGTKPPQHARQLVQLWRPWIEEKVAGQLDHLIDALHDQTAFSRMTRHMIASLDMADELGQDPDDRESTEAEDDENADPGERSEESEQAEDDPDSSRGEDTEQGPSESDGTEQEEAESAGNEVAEDTDSEQTPDAEEP
ncbi:MAG: cobaltochelatase subunit CobT, partial [Pseudomonadota bacterium]|nr:cobaltochelatase subunit CobT [Pseudomonadota bacterium]